jgi:hypothetical protein
MTPCNEKDTFGSVILIAVCFATGATANKKAGHIPVTCLLFGEVIPLQL